MNRVSPEANSRDCIYIRGKETPINMKQLPVERWYPWCNATKLDTIIKLWQLQLQRTPRGILIQCCQSALGEPAYAILDYYIRLSSFDQITGRSHVKRSIPLVIANAAWQAVFRACFYARRRHYANTPFSF